MRFLLIFLFIIVYAGAAEKPLEKVSLQLQWLDQFQFAGYYMAKEKGFYADEGFDVEIKKFSNATNVVSEVLNKKSTYGIGRSSLIWYYSKGNEISLLSATFQSSPLALIALESSNIEDVKDFASKTIMITEDAVETASVYAMIKSAKVDDKTIEFKKSTFDVGDLIDGNVDLYGGYISNETFVLEKKGIKYKLFYPKDMGFDFYDDILFTSQEEVRKNPDRVERFKNASIMGWEYAFKNINETVDVIYEKYNPTDKTKEALLYEAHTLKKLAFANGTALGSIKKEKVERILDIYRVMGLVDSDVDLDKLLFNAKEKLFSEQEEEYLREKGHINVCATASLLPFSDVEHGRFIGIGSDVLNLTKEHADISYRVVEAKSHRESLQNLRDKKCDLLPTAKYNKADKGFKTTTPYHYEPLVIVTKKSENYIVDIDGIVDQEFVVVRGNPFVDELRDKYPNIKLHYVESLEDGFVGVKRGKYYGYIDSLISVAYALKNVSNGNLKISGQFNEKIGIGFGVRDDDEILFNIFQKLTKDIKHPDIHGFFNDWVSINYVKSVRFDYYYEIIILISAIMFLFFYRQNTLKKKNIELEELRDKLLKLNSTLELKIAEAVNEMQQKDTYLLHKSRLAQMGEMVSMIAHQWKQPLNAISTLQISMIMALEFEEYNICDEKEHERFLKFLDEKLKKIGLYTQNLSRIVSDFSDFYRPNKHQEEQTLTDPVQQAHWLIEDSLVSENIELRLKLTSHNKVMLFKNEFIQVILNIINNARDQFREKNIEDAQIVIKSYDRDDMAVLEISDNALGIDEDIIDRIFDPYFSTKFDKNGTGLGLHMSKSIVEQHYRGKIYAQNIDGGAKFIIEVGRHNEE